MTCSAHRAHLLEHEVDSPDQLIELMVSRRGSCGRHQALVARIELVQKLLGLVESVIVFGHDGKATAAFETPQGVDL